MQTAGTAEGKYREPNPDPHTIKLYPDPKNCYPGKKITPLLLFLHLRNHPISSAIAACLAFGGGGGKNVGGAQYFLRKR